MLKLVIAAVIVGAGLTASGCASIVSSSHWPVTINSNPSGAMVIVRNERGLEVQKGATPMTIMLPSGAGYFRSASYQFTFEKEGYSPATASLSAHMNGWYVGNILFGGLIGFLIVDPITGAMWRLDDVVYGNMAPDTNAPPKATVAPPGSVGHPAATTDDIPTQLKKLKDLKDAGVLTEQEYETKRKALVEKL